MSENLKAVDIFTDGACSGNPGPGGWAAILRYGQHEMEISGSMPQTTNNRMEVFAVISALGKLKTRCHVTVHSDSAYLINAFNQHWIENWQKRGWKNSEGKPVENQDLWRLLLLTINKKGHVMVFNKVKGHADHPENIRCDALAREAIKQYLARNPDLGDPENINILHSQE
ncbi:MAG: ribonuclease HI [Clostridiales bacterium]|nr:ribonuclease HI [Clostridiales bacterium]